MSKVIAVLSDDDAALSKYITALREKGSTARGLTARLWNGADEPNVSAWHVVAATDAEASALEKRIKAANADAEVVKIVTKARTPKTEGGPPTT